MTAFNRQAALVTLVAVTQCGSVFLEPRDTAFAQQAPVVKAEAPKRYFPMQDIQKKRVQEAHKLAKQEIERLHKESEDQKLREQKEVIAKQKEQIKDLKQQAKKQEARCLTVGGAKRGQYDSLQKSGDDGAGAGKPCQFPFKYNHMTYHSCTEDDSPGKPWCDVADGEWGYCSDTIACKADYAIGARGKTDCPDNYVQTMSEAACDTAAMALGYSYAGKMNSSAHPPGCYYPGCDECDKTVRFNVHSTGAANQYANPMCNKACSTYADKGACPTVRCAWTGSACEDGCLTVGGAEITGPAGVGAGQVCTFPFRYKGIDYHSCTERDDPGKPWCGNIAGTAGWGYCGKSPVCQADREKNKAHPSFKVKISEGKVSDVKTETKIIDAKVLKPGAKKQEPQVPYKRFLQSEDEEGEEDLERAEDDEEDSSLQEEDEENEEPEESLLQEDDEDDDEDEE